MGDERRREAVQAVSWLCIQCGLRLVLPADDLRCLVRVAPRCERCGGRTVRVRRGGPDRRGA